VAAATAPPPATLGMALLCPQCLGAPLRTIPYKCVHDHAFCEACYGRLRARHAKCPLCAQHARRAPLATAERFRGGVWSTEAADLVRAVWTDLSVYSSALGPLPAALPVLRHPAETPTSAESVGGRGVFPATVGQPRPGARAPRPTADALDGAARGGGGAGRRSSSCTRTRRVAASS
jgi:hypothetical protein